MERVAPHVFKLKTNSFETILKSRTFVLVATGTQVANDESRQTFQGKICNVFIGYGCTVTEPKGNMLWFWTC